MEKRLDITLTLPLTEPVKIETKKDGKVLIRSVEWVLNAYQSSPHHLRGLGRGHYQVYTSFRLDTAPEWAPKPPEGWVEAALALLDLEA